MLGSLKPIFDIAGKKVQILQDEVLGVQYKILRLGTNKN